MRQLRRSKAFDQRHPNIHHSISVWRGSAASRQIFKTHKPKSSDQNSHKGPVTTQPTSGSVHLYFIFSHTLKDVSGHNQRLQERTPFSRKEGSYWSLHQKRLKKRLKRLQNSTEGTWFCILLQQAVRS